MRHIDWCKIDSILNTKYGTLNSPNKNSLFGNQIDQSFSMSLKYVLTVDINSFVLGMMIKRDGVDVCYSLDTDFGMTNYRTKGIYESEIHFQKMFLKEGDYSISFYFVNTLDGSWHNAYENVVNFRIVSNNINTTNKGYCAERVGSVIFQGSWETNT